jgi:hypothetical protein
VCVLVQYSFDCHYCSGSRSGSLLQEQEQEQENAAVIVVASNRKLVLDVGIQQTLNLIAKQLDSQFRWTTNNGAIEAPILQVSSLVVSLPWKTQAAGARGTHTNRTGPETQ